MARSAEALSKLAVLAGLAGAAVLLAGCVTTQERNARAKLSAERQIAARTPLRLGTRNAQVDVTRATLVRGRGRDRTAVVVELRSRARTPLTDLPIGVGVRTRNGERHALNGGRDLDWFETHVAALAPGATTTWVFTARRRAPAGARAYAQVGLPPAKPASRASSLPRLQAGDLDGGRVRVRNGSDIPQVDLPVYAVATANGRYVAAGRASIPKLSGNGEATVAVSLVGARNARQTQVHVLPTIFE
ncbi:MAG: hypothetical protein ABUM26_07205 [Solirubrobacterales bacterium]